MKRFSYKFIVGGRGSRSALTTVEITIISGVVLFLGIFVLYIANNWYLGSTLEATEQTDMYVEMIRSALIIEKIVYDYENNKASITLRNIAKDNFALRIIAVELLRIDNNLIGQRSLIDGGYILRRGERLDLVKDGEVPACINCHRGELLKYRVWYAAERFGDDLASISRRATFIESSFIYGGGPLLLQCPPPEDYVLVDIVDPILLTSGEFRSPIVYVRPGIKIPSPSTIDLVVVVESIMDGKTGFGFLEDVRVPTLEQVSVRGSFQGVKVPFKVNVYSPDTKIIPQVWVMDGIPNQVIISGITLLWKETDYTVHTVIVEVAAPSLPEDVVIKISAKLLDCKGNKLDEVEVRDRIPSGGDVDKPVFLKLNKPIRFDQLYTIETKLIEVK